ncbi:amidohydrolase [Merdimmobilis hominis]|jgi:amidohydrolase|uniref:p-aminobenzoyl-glutamate hydrolase subunit B n=1 Tax=uncultured Anaerotruncus sp. TaxID=905011 RepID=A0A6N2TGV6_9FIRM|nr:amidohydrolase [Merdimmobilis hominis]MCD4835766.1 amidohydrolase [Merdimmobilis hominis]PWL56447.1 MAG: amidohydrolase [Oscillospiraceae bacterium]
MSVSREELKRRACEAVDKNRDKIIAFGESVFAEPELGFKEFKTSAKVKKAFEEMGVAYTDGHAITGVIAPFKGKESKLKVALMGELDAVVCPGHRCADPVTGAAHSCGHHVQIASIIGCGLALKDSGIMDELSGDIVLMGVPAEEGVELEYRAGLIKEGKIHFLGGKQEFIYEGVFDDIDMMIMQHTMVDENVKATAGGAVGKGFIAKYIRYIGKEAHAGGAPHLGINALNAAQIGLMAINAQRETFQDKDSVRVHPIITKGGDLVNVVPADVRIETFCRGNNEPAILDASKKVDRALKAGADAVGAQVEIIDLPGYMLPYEHLPLKELVTENLEALVGKENVGPGVGYTTDANDVAHIVPTVHACIAGAAGVGHSSEYEITDKENAYIVATKMMLMSCIDLLADGAERGLKIKESWKAPYTKEQYLKEWGNL